MNRKSFRRSARPAQSTTVRAFALTLVSVFGFLLGNTILPNSRDSAINRATMPIVAANSNYFVLSNGNLTQNWSNTNLIATSDNWDNVPSIIGFRGDGLANQTGVDPQTVTADGAATPVDVNANQTNPNTFAIGGVTEFEISDPTVALAGSATARAPHLVIFLNTTGQRAIRIRYNLRDIDGSADNAVQPIALQFRVGTSGDFVNVPAGFVADASSGPNLAAQVTAVSAILPAAASNQPQVQVRIITTDAVSADEYIGVDDIIVSSVPTTAAAVEIGGRVLDQNGRGIARATISMIDNSGNERQIKTNNFGYYRFSEVPAGESYTFAVSHKEFVFAQQIVTISQAVENLDFVAEPRAVESAEHTPETRERRGNRQP